MVINVLQFDTVDEITNNTSRIEKVHTFSHRKNNNKYQLKMKQRRSLLIRQKTLNFGEESLWSSSYNTGLWNWCKRVRSSVAVMFSFGQITKWIVSYSLFPSDGLNIITDVL